MGGWATIQDFEHNFKTQYFVLSNERTGCTVIEDYQRHFSILMKLSLTKFFA